METLILREASTASEDIFALIELLSMSLLQTPNHLMSPIFKYHFYDLKITFDYTGAIPENFMSKCTQEVRVAYFAKQYVYSFL